MKIIIIFITFTAIATFSQSSWQNADSNYLPMEEGNQWNYLKWTFTDQHWNTKRIEQLSVHNDTTIGAEVYKHLVLSEYGNQNPNLNTDIFLRVVEDSNKIFINNAGQEYIHYDLDWEQGETYNICDYATLVYREATVIDEYKNIFGAERKTKGYVVDASKGTWERHFTQGIGFTYFYKDSYFYYDNSPIDHDFWYELIEAKIDTGNGFKIYSEGRKPTIGEVSPNFNRTDQIMTDTIKVTHFFDKDFEEPIFPTFSFIEETWAEVKYFKDGVEQKKEIWRSNRLDDMVSFRMAFSIDTAYMSDGKEIRWRVGARDKYILNKNIVSYPENGWFIINNDFTDVQTETYKIDYQLAQNYPNPFNPSTNITYEIPEGGLVSIIVYDVLGRTVSTIVNEYKSAGRYKAKFTAVNLGAGIYYYRLKVNKFSKTRKMILLK